MSGEEDFSLHFCFIYGLSIVILTARGGDSIHLDGERRPRSCKALPVLQGPDSATLPLSLCDSSRFGLGGAAPERRQLLRSAGNVTPGLRY